MASRTLTTATLLTAAAIALPATQAAAGSVTLQTAGVAADLDNQRGGGSLADLIGTESAFATQDQIGDGTPIESLLFGVSTRFTEASIDAREPFENNIDVSGTSRTPEGGESFHLVELNVTLDAGESFLATAHELGDGVINDFDRAFLSSVQLFDAEGDAVDLSSIIVDDSDSDSPSISFAPGAGNFLAVFSASSPSPAGDDEFRVRFSTVSGVPSPTAAAAGLLGLIGLAGRRRRNG